MIDCSTLINTSNDAMIAIKSDETIVMWNSAATRMFGWQYEEMINSELIRIIPEKFRKGHKEGIKRALTGVFNVIGSTVELIGLHKDGGEFPIELTLSSWNESGVIYFAGVIRDIRRRKQLERDRSHVESRFQSIANSSNDAILSMSQDSKVVSWNKGAENVFGYSFQEIVGQDICIIIPERYRQSHRQGLERFLNTGKENIIGTTVEVTGLHKDGREFPIELSLSAWKEGRASFFAGIIRDISERKEIERLLQEEKQLLAKEKERSEKLLLNILPFDIAVELRTTGKVEAKSYSDVTVLFADFVSFSNIAGMISAQELVRQLDYYFKKFDSIIEKYGLEKIKTIGDSYMCASGVPEENSGCIIGVILAAKEMIEFVKNSNLNNLNTPAWQLKIGINSGPVVAGVVGIKKFVFDIWGETVNLASRIESYGFPEEITISENTMNRIKDIFDCKSKGNIAFRNMGNHMIYTISGFKEKADPSVKGDGSSREFTISCKMATNCKKRECGIESQSSQGRNEPARKIS